MTRLARPDATRQVAQSIGALLERRDDRGALTSSRAGNSDVLRGETLLPGFAPLLRLHC